MSRSAFGAEFVGAEGFLNSANYGLPPTFVSAAMREYVTAWESGTMDLRSFDEPGRVAREAYAALVGVSPDAVTQNSSVSAAIGLVAAAVPDGTRVATVGGEFTSVTYPFAAQARRGVTVTELDPDVLVASAAEFDVVAVSLVQSSSGAVLDTAALRSALAGSETWAVIDATQALGWLAVDLSWADVSVAPGYKWLLGARGCSWMSLSDRVSDAMTAHGANWFGSDDPWSSIYGLPLKQSEQARRFDSSPVWFATLAASLSLPWAASLDRRAVQAHAVGLADRLRAELEMPPAPSAIVSIPDVSAADRLHDAGIRVSIRAGAIRVAFHLYNTEDDLDRLVDALRA